MTYYKPLTPEFRARINESVRSIEIELNTCQNTPYVTAQKIGLQALENLINALPDGFPLPMKMREGGMTMKFETSKRIDKWMENHRKSGCVSHVTAGEQFVFEFLPSGIVECQTVKCLCCGKEFTDYVD